MISNQYRSLPILEEDDGAALVLTPGLFIGLGTVLGFSLTGHLECPPVIS